MKVILVEDEKLARQQLAMMLHELDPEIEILAQMDTVSQTVNWLQANQADLIFLDIHLADDLSFKIFDQVDVQIPIIFTTAYDQYAIKAFKVNSIDYLLKPIEKEELQQALDKYLSLQKPAALDLKKLESMLLKRDDKVVQKRFLVQRRDRMMSVKIEDVAYFEGEDRYVYLTKTDGSRYIVDYKLSELEEILDPSTFFRLNRSFIAHFEAIERIISMSKSRVKVELQPTPSRDIVVSTDNTRNFKLWLNR